MPTHSRTPTYAPRAVADPRRPRPLSALLHAALLAVIGLCVLAHGPSEEPGRPTPAVTAAWAPPAGEALPHGPHRHQGDAECAVDEAVRTTTQAVQQPPVDAGAAALVGAPAVLGGPPARRRPHRRRGRRTGRTALVRTSRWRI
ncbi:hypothetical protein EAO75_14875 [Streptomyces sp. uw30]|uniref:hypothetical protein n=1 Tax=Streptomyces sp. uw30 TaxID=1828179 RepID=UPI0011CD579B|nr:hypothetical protein [Streptomyces sp. uw30]TXS49330.1 hypothetical protein EAO75_14875 [Streptomyces sp. uw30]